VVFLDCPKD
jgi:hypothetical protein